MRFYLHLNFRQGEWQTRLSVQFVYDSHVYNKCGQEPLDELENPSRGNLQKH